MNIIHLTLKIYVYSLNYLLLKENFRASKFDELLYIWKNKNIFFEFDFCKLFIHPTLSNHFVIIIVLNSFFVHFSEYTGVIITLYIMHIEYRANNLLFINI